MLEELISGFIAVSLLTLFLGFYAVRLKSIPLWIIIVGVLVMVFLNFYEGIVKGRNRGGG